MSELASTDLHGRRILVAEDEYMIAQEIVDALSDVGATILGPVSRLKDAIRLLTMENRIDGALLDVNLSNEAIWPVVDALQARAVPLVLATGYDTSAIPAAYAGLPRCEKPATGQDLARTLAKVITDVTRG
ncbi:response regulator [Lichenihabitans sp. Uapishka_5]|uniref:response regulator n=1 Tax=Lichenihabitans sp. Uapishka_5 TaxID=3037302 RepID=UPI0029E7CBFE|nr:response regulator [Lichenihabitans sp. Uapishka_5]MDX7950234.1 response regulator [Lichenihabitans sp. Uapishka_5]